MIEVPRLKITGISADLPKSLAEVTAERALLAYLDGSCQTPIAASARLHDDHDADA